MFIVFDLDGTLADDTHRQHFLLQEPKDWDSYFAACEGDEPIGPVIDLLRALRLLIGLRPNLRIEIWTGRSAKSRKQTKKWLLYNAGLPGYIVDSMLRMRPAEDYRPDTVLKGEWLEKYGKPDLIFDDRNKSVRFWREQGIVCLQVADHDY